MNEFELIRRYFVRQHPARADVVLGIGDDAAVLQVPRDQALVVSTDTLISGVHFPADTDAESIGYKSLAVNLSDLAAMGAEPAWFTLNLSLPETDETWLAGFATGLFALADAHGVQLVGGDTTRGPLTITLGVYGLVPTGQALTRSGARPDDHVYVTGKLGEAAMGLKLRQGTLTLLEPQQAPVLARLNRPSPRVNEGQLLRGLASACIDISDGLLADLGHILQASGVGACIHLSQLPLSSAYNTHFPQLGWEPALAHGDDYELCFTLPAANKMTFQKNLAAFHAGVHDIGTIEAQPGLRIMTPEGHLYHPKAQGYDHFPRPRLKP